MSLGLSRRVGITEAVTERQAQAQSGPRPWAGAALAFMSLAGLVSVAAAQGSSWRTPALALVGAALGFTLFQSTFGFAGGFRAVLERRDASGFRAQALALALSSMTFFPLLAWGEVFGQPLGGFASPIGVSFVFGAILFGIGMQIGGGCASGTLFMLGGGNLKLLVTLAFFVVGSGLGAGTLDVWWSLPAWPALTAQDVMGWPVALVVHLLIFGLLAAGLPSPKAEAGLGSPDNSDGFSLLRPWSLWTGAGALAGLNTLTLVLSGHPWGETSGFTLWASKLAGVVGFVPASWPYWRDDPSALGRSIFADVTSVMDIGIIIGACLAALGSGRFVWKWRLHRSDFAGAILGGLLMGYGARLSGGCNIGAYFSALASGSLSGWVWIMAAFVGSAVGLKFRTKLDVPGP